MFRERRTIGSDGLISASKKPRYTPKPVNMMLDSTENKPYPSYVTTDKAKAESDRRYQEQIDRQNAAQPSGKSVICTRFYELGYMDVHSWALDEAFGEVLRVYEPDLMAWYSRHAPKVVRLMKNDGWFVRLLWRFFGKHWAQHMKHEMNPCIEDSAYGRKLMNIGRFICKL